MEVMRRANRPLALALLFVAVLCSPAGVCVVEAVAVSADAGAPVHAHACCKQGDGTTIAASNGSCCAEGQNGFINAFRFALQKSITAPSPAVATNWTPRPFVIDVSGFGRAAPLVLRI